MWVSGCLAMRCKVQKRRVLKSWPPASRGHAVSPPPASMIKGPLAPTPFSQGAGLPIHYPLLETRVPRCRQRHKTPPPDNAVYIAGTVHAREEEWGTDWCVFRTSTTRAPSPPSRLISPSRPISHAVPAHRSEDVPTCQTAVNPGAWA